MPTTHRKKLIEVALPLEAINEASAREKSIRHGHPSTLHLWWARRPLAAARAVIFASLVDDPDSSDALPAFVEACKKLPVGANVKANGDTPRMRLFDFIERLVTWEATTDEAILNTARELIQIATEGNPPPLLDPFAGGGSIPLEAQRLGLEAHASDLNPVAVMINKAQIEIPPRFANMPPVNPRDNALTPQSPLPPQAEERGGNTEGNDDTDRVKPERWHIPPEMRERMTQIARNLRKSSTPSEDILWQAVRNRQLDGKKFKRQVDIGPFVLDFYCPEERLAVEVDGPIHATQVEADRERQRMIESLGIRFVRITSQVVETNIADALNRIRAAFGARRQTVLPLSSRSVGEGAGGEGALWRGAAGLAADVRYYGEWMREKAWEKIGHLYPPLIPNPSPTARGGEGNSTANASQTPVSSRSTGSTTTTSKTPLSSRSTDATATSSQTPLSSRSVGEGRGVRGETVIAWIWARTVKSPNPAVDAHVPLVRSFELSKKKGKRAWIEPVVERMTDASTTHRIRFVIRREQDGDSPKSISEGTVDRRGGRCLVSGVPIPFEYIRAEGKAGRMGAQLMAIVTEGSSGRSYYAPTAEHESTAAEAEPEWVPAGDIPEQALGFRVQLYGMDEYNKLFTPRQLVALTTFSDLVAEAREQAHADALAAGLPDDSIPLRDGGRGALAYAEAVSVYLAFGVDRGADYWSSLCGWHYSGEKIDHVFRRQALSMVWDHAEVNPFSDSTGNWIACLEWCWKALVNLPSRYHGEAAQSDAMRVEAERQLVLSTDPPYYDNIGYADLSDFFYIWLRRSLRTTYPDIFATLLVPKESELIVNPFRHDGSREVANLHFESGMLNAFSNFRRFTDERYPLTVYYAFKQQDVSHSNAEDEQNTAAVTSTGWETMLSALIDAGFSIDGTWPVRTELGNRMRNLDSNALASSIVLVCRPRPENAPSISRRAFVDMLRRELPAALKNMQSGNIAPVDLAQASIGPGMAIYSRHSKVLEADGSALTVRTALGLINTALDDYLAEQDGDIDPETRFAVAWFEQFAFREGEFGVADVLARAKNTSVASVELSGLVKAGKGKVKLTHWSEYDPGKAWNPQSDKRPTVWEAAHHLIERLNTHGEEGSAALMLVMPPEMAAEARNLAYRLYNICERKGWADHARDYNALVVSWSGIGEVAAQKRAAGESGEARRQPGLFDE